MSMYIQAGQSFFLHDSQLRTGRAGKYPTWKMKAATPKYLERNSRISMATVKNKAEQHSLNFELDYLEREKKTALRMLKNDKQCFRVKYSKNNIIRGDIDSNEVLSKYYIPSIIESTETIDRSFGDASSKYSFMEFQQIHNMLFTNEEIDIEKILCLHLISAHRSESLAPPRKKLAHMCKIHSPLERLLERSKRKNIHTEQKMTNLLPIYTIEITEFGSHAASKDLINDGRLATRILLNEKVRELINTVLSALKQSNPEKNYEIFELANDISSLKKLFTQKKILSFLEDLMSSPLINSCESFILTAPFRVKSVQLEIRTISGTLELLVKQIRHNVLQLPTRAQTKIKEIIDEEEDENSKKTHLHSDTNHRRRMARRKSSDATKTLEELYADKQPKTSFESEKKVGRHVDTNYIQKNIQAASCAKRVEYDNDDDEYFDKFRRSSQTSSRSRRRSSESGNIAERPHIQPIRLSEEESMILEDKEDDLDDKDDSKTERNTNIQNKENKSNDTKQNLGDFNNRRRLSSDSEHIKIHLKQTTCPACMERYKIPLPTPKTPNVKVTSVLPLAPGENPDLKTNSKNRLSMLINKEMFKLQSYERRFSSEEHSRRNSLRKKEIETCSSSYLNLSPLELAKIDQEIREKETQKKLEKFLQK